MKKLEAIIKPYLLEDLRDCLHDRGFVAMTVSEIRRFRDLAKRAPGPPDGNLPFEVDFDPSLKVEVVIVDGREHAAIEAIQSISPSAPITVQHIHDAVRIRTNEHGDIAV